MNFNVSDDSSARQYVERLLRENDIKGAIDFARRVQNSYPKLKKLLHFLANIVVQVYSEDEEIDWYTILGVDPLVDFKTMKQRYAKFAINNRLKSFEAHKLLNKAWDILSNKFTRKEFNLRRRSREMQQNALAVKQASSANENVPQAFSNVNQKSLSNNCCNGGSDQRNKFADERETSAMNCENFWNPEEIIYFLTACPSCYYESHRECLISKASCLQCGTTFAAIDIPSPEVSEDDCVQYGRSFAAIEVPSPDVKHRELMGLVEDTGNSSNNVTEIHMPAGSEGQKGAFLCQRENSRAEKEGASGSSKGNTKKRLSDVEKNIFIKKGRSTILNQRSEWNAAAMDDNEHNAADSIENAAIKGHKGDGLKTMEVPDSDFYDFDKDRSQKSFAENQVWAVYVEDDGMPRQYALIRKVSRRPHELHISWLNSKCDMELESVKWIDSGTHQTCGDFWVEKKEMSIKLNSFSHRVTGWTKAARGFKIFPKRGDVWALYRNWSIYWNEHTTTEEEKHKYDMMKVLGDYDEEKGVTLVPLMKVAGFTAVFCQHLGAKEVIVPKEEIFRFSHKVTSHHLTDQEALNVPKGSMELDPAALPLELLQVIH